MNALARAAEIDLKRQISASVERVLDFSRPAPETMPTLRQLGEQIANARGRGMTRAQLTEDDLRDIEARLLAHRMGGLQVLYESPREWLRSKLFEAGLGEEFLPGK